MKLTEANILIVDDDLDVLVTAQLFLKQLFTFIKVEQRPENIPSLMETIEFDIILLDMNFSKGKNDGEEGIQWLNKILSINPPTVVVFITAYGGVNLAVQSMKVGAFDFIVKPWKNENLLSVIYAGLQFRKSKLEVEYLKNSQQKLNEDIDANFKDFIGESLAIKKVFETIKKVSKTDADVLILGENGTGKELVAREIHKQSLRNEKAFVNVDLGSLPETLFESELFGHEKGAFTDAKESKAGRFELANGGTLFLDEIGNLPIALQNKLLGVLQNREVNRLGSSKKIPIDIRLICATNKPLNEMVGIGEFREDLLYRINTLELNVPPLRERPSDILLLIEFFLRKYSKKYDKPKLKTNQSLLNKLSKYHWPGNIRELQHAVERAVILSEDNTLNLKDFSMDFSNPSPLSKRETLNLAELEKRYILKAISKNKGNITKAAKDLGIARTALYRRLDKYGL